MERTEIKIGKMIIMEFFKDWNDLARNAGRKFTPTTAHEPDQPAFDFGDIEMQLHLSTTPFKETG